MAWVAAARPGDASVYQWLASREARAVAAGGVLADEAAGTSYDGCAERLAAFRRGDAVDLPVTALPPWAREGEVRWWQRVTVSADCALRFWDDDGRAWLAEAGL